MDLDTTTVDMLRSAGFAVPTLDNLRRIVQTLPPEQQTRFQDLLTSLDDDNRRVPKPSYLPKSLLDALERYVFPGFRINAGRPPSFLASKSRKSTDTTAYLGSNPSLTLSIEPAPLNQHIQDAVRAAINADLPETSPTVRDWTRRYINSYEPLLSTPAAYEDDLSAIALPHLAYPINCLFDDEEVFASGSTERYPPKWQRPQQAAKLGLTDWLCSNRHSDPSHGTNRGVLEWKRKIVLTTIAIMEMHRIAQLGDLQLTLHSDGKITTSNNSIGRNMRKVIFQLWGQAHHYSCRWLVLFNTEVMVVFYLADTTRLFVSNVISMNDGEIPRRPTFASILFGIGLDLPPPAAPPGVDAPATDIVFRSIPLADLASFEPHIEDATHDVLPTLMEIDEAGPVGGSPPRSRTQRQVMDLVNVPFSRVNSSGALLSGDLPCDLPNIECGVLTILVGSPLSRGRLWHSYSATLIGNWDNLRTCTAINIELDPSLSSPTPAQTPSLSPSKSADSDDPVETHVVLRLASTRRFDDDDPEARIRNEAQIYTGPGLGLQGSTLPRWGGLFATAIRGATGQRSWASVLEDVGHSAPSTSEAEPGLPFQGRYVNEVLCKYNALHDSGIAHGDVERRHVRVGTGPAARLYSDPLGCLPPRADLGLRLIDFDMASTDPAEVRKERQSVRRWLGVRDTV